MKLALVDGRIDRECELSLIKEGFRVVKLSPAEKLSPAVASHTDMLVFSFDKELVFTADYCEENEELIKAIRSFLPSFKISLTSVAHSKEYPRDCIFNALAVGDKLFARLDSLSPYIKERAEALGMRLVNVNQGYAACTSLRLSESTVITADEGMARALLCEGVRVVKIEKGHIILPPHEYGFIGGAGAVYSGKLYFLGDVRLHPSYDAISEAAKSEGLEIVCLSSFPLRDLGGILFAECDVNYNREYRNEKKPENSEERKADV